MNREETIKWLKSLKAEIGKSEHRTLWHYAEALDMAIEVLTYQNLTKPNKICEADLISREDAIEAVCDKCPVSFKEKCEWRNNGHCSTKVALEALPSVEVEWIPCSEKLPEDGIAVLTTTENREVYIDQVITDPYKERYFQSNTAYDNFQVIAWMPLPKPYREDNE